MTAHPASLRIERGSDPFEWIDRARPIAMSFEGEPVAAWQGDSIASALWAGGHRVLGESAKKRRPRGLDASVLVAEASQGALVAEQTPARSGMDLRRLRWPHGPVPDWTRAPSLLESGGLYDPISLSDRAFESSVRSWISATPFPGETARATWPRLHRTTEVMVVGGGLAGLSAAVAAAERGLGVMLTETDASCGGRAFDAESQRALAALLERARALDNLTIVCGSIALGLYEPPSVVLHAPSGIVHVHAGRLILATGRLDVPAVFAGNDTPGVMTTMTADRLVARYGVMPCRRAVVLTADDDGYACAARLRDAGVTIVAILDARERAARSGRAPEGVTWAAIVDEARAGEDGTLVGVRARVRAGTRASWECDGLVGAAGTIAADQLALQAQRDHAPVFRPLDQGVAAGVFAAGSVRGHSTCAECLEDGARVAALVAESFAGASSVAAAFRAESAVSSEPAVSVPPARGLIDPEEEVEVDDIKSAVAAGFRDSGLLNAFTKFGRGFGQSKASHRLAAELLAEQTGQSLEAVGRPVPRPPVRPVAMQVLAGRRWRPRRRTALHDWHAEHGAELVAADEWERPAVYRRGADRARAVEEEVLVVRQAVGIIDVGTLGKIDLVGPDAAVFLEQVYTGRYGDLAVGGARYALLCDETGSIVDDGVVARLADEHFYLTTTTTGSGAVYRELQRWLIELGLDVTLHNLTGTYAAMNLAGPRAREVIAKVADEPAPLLACPYPGARVASVGGVSLRALRVGFVGEIGYELHVPSGFALGVWRRILAAGEEQGIRPFGVEAQRMLRLEKGHLVLGQDTDALATPHEVGLAGAVKMKKPAFVGRRSLLIRANRPARRALVGFELAPGYRGPVVSECDLVVDGDAISGRVTSVGNSPTLGRVIGLAFVPPAIARPGQSFVIRAGAAHRVDATVARTPFYDPENHRQQLGARP